MEGTRKWMLECEKIESVVEPGTVFPALVYCQQLPRSHRGRVIWSIRDVSGVEFNVHGHARFDGVLAVRWPAD